MPSNSLKWEIALQKVGASYQIRDKRFRGYLETDSRMWWNQRNSNRDLKASKIYWKDRKCDRK